MQKNIKKIIRTSQYVFCCLVLLILPFNSLLANGADAAKELKKTEFGLKSLAAKIGLETANPPTISQVLGQIIGVVLSLLGIIFMLLVIYGGFSWMTARGDEEKVKSSKAVIVNAIIGMIVVFSAYVLSSLIIDFLYTATKVGL
jgi:hypothetical protein